MLVPIIQRGLREGLSANEMYRQTANTPLGIRRKDFLDLVREIAGREKQAEETIKYTRTEYLFPRGAEPVEWRLKQPLLYRFSVLYEGEEKPRYFSFYSDKPLLPERAEEIMRTILEEKSYEYWEELDLAGKNVIEFSMAKPLVSKEFSPAWLRKRFGF